MPLEIIGPLNHIVIDDGDLIAPHPENYDHVVYKSDLFAYEVNPAAQARVDAFMQRYLIERNSSQVKSLRFNILRCLIESRNTGLMLMEQILAADPSLVHAVAQDDNTTLLMNLVLQFFRPDNTLLKIKALLQSGADPKESTSLNFGDKLPRIVNAVDSILISLHWTSLGQAVFISPEENDTCMLNSAEALALLLKDHTEDEQQDVFNYADTQLAQSVEKNEPFAYLFAAACNQAKQYVRAKPAMLAFSDNLQREGKPLQINAMVVKGDGDHALRSRMLDFLSLPKVSKPAP